MCVQIWNQKLQQDEFTDVTMTSTRRILLGRRVRSEAIQGLSGQAPLMSTISSSYTLQVLTSNTYLEVFPETD